jgi:hypothetical protein
MDSQDKIQFVLEQVIKLRNGDDVPLEVSCPYCLSTSVPGTEFCCKTMHNALAVIMDRQDLLDKIDTAERIREKSYRGH